MNKNTAIGISTIAIIIAIFVIIYLSSENKEKNKKIKELEEDKLKLILDSLKSRNDISDEVKNQIEKLARQFENVDKKISNELVQALQLFQIGQVENAIEDLVKIIEHLLTKYYIDKEEFKDWCKEKKKNFKQPKLADLLEYSLNDNKISSIEHKFFVAIKEIRNKEDHTLDLTLDKYINTSGIITAIGAIVKFSELAYPSKGDILLN
jgi:hypothetical protein